MATVMTAVQRFTVSIAGIEDAKGNPASIQGVPAWSTTRPDLFTLTAAADGMSCVVEAIGPRGTGTVTVVADANMSPTEVTEIVGTCEVTVVSAQAVRIVLAEGTPENVT